MIASSTAMVPFILQLSDCFEVGSTVRMRGRLKIYASLIITIVPLDDTLQGKDNGCHGPRVCHMLRTPFPTNAVRQSSRWRVFCKRHRQHMSQKKHATRCNIAARTAPQLFGTIVPVLRTPLLLPANLPRKLLLPTLTVQTCSTAVYPVTLSHYRPETKSRSLGCCETHRKALAEH
jgi:hypothetical protein